MEAYRTAGASRVRGVGTGRRKQVMPWTRWAAGIEPRPVIIGCVDPSLTHVASDGTPRMVDVGDKPLSRRRAVVVGRVRMSPATRALALGAGGPKGAVLDVARLAGIGGAKRTADLVPLCHPLPIDAVRVDIEPEGDDALRIRAEVVTTWRTGVEMEAFTAVAAAGLTVIDMLKAVERELVLEDVRLEHKSGGRSGTWDRPAP